MDDIDDSFQLASKAFAEAACNFCSDGDYTYIYEMDDAVNELIETVGLERLIFCRNRDGETPIELALKVDMDVEDFGEGDNRLGVMVSLVARFLRAQADAETNLERIPKHSRKLPPIGMMGWRALLLVFQYMELDEGGTEFLDHDADVAEDLIVPAWNSLIQPLLDAGANPNSNLRDAPPAPRRVKCSLKTAHGGLLHALLENYFIDETFYDANDYDISNEDIKLAFLDRMIAAGCEVDYQDPVTGQTLLHVAIQRRFFRISARLVELGVPLDAVTTSVATPGYGMRQAGETALLWACRLGAISTVRMLLQDDRSSICISMYNTLGETPLHIACGQGFSAIALALIDRHPRICEAGMLLRDHSDSPMTSFEIATSKQMLDVTFRILRVIPQHVK